ncbi:9065_t:CDS:2 [Gigaspora rosea]|nr:9065_t:CDS:2 [Gigaspora rosea]
MKKSSPENEVDRESEARRKTYNNANEKIMTIPGWIVITFLEIKGIVSLWTIVKDTISTNLAQLGERQTEVLSDI